MPALIAIAVPIAVDAISVLVLNRDFNVEDWRTVMKSSLARMQLGCLLLVLLVTSAMATPYERATRRV